ncbi:MAG: hypothetical protein LAQ30_20920 [Acidobacteriia bacterium]|nr:hypothetical protein [Terriglobia bacterium]
MTARKSRLIAAGFALVGVASLAAALLPAAKGQPVRVTFLAVGVFWLSLSVVIWRKLSGRI